MTEHDLALRDLRADLITEIADSMPGASAAAVVAAIVSRLGEGLPRMVEVEVETEQEAAS